MDKISECNLLNIIETPLGLKDYIDNQIVKIEKSLTFLLFDPTLFPSHLFMLL